MLDAALADAQYALGAATMRTVDLDGDGVASASELETARQNVRLREDQSPPDGAFEGSRSGASDGMGQRGGPEIAVERRVTYSRSQLTAWRADFERANAVIRAVYNQDASNYAEGIRAIDYRFEQLNRLDQLAFEQVDLPIMYFTGGIVGGAAVAAGGSILAGGYAGVTTFGINITFDGLSSGVAGSGMRGAAGGQNTIATFTTDAVYGAGGSGILRAALAAGGFAFSRIGTGGANAAETIDAAHPLAGIAARDVVDMAAARGLSTQRDSLILWS